MKSRTSFCNMTVLRKDLTRFAPVWGCYCVFLLLMLAGLIGLGNDYIRALNAANYVTYMATVNLIYAFLVVQMLFGDLYNSRMCNALHALPLKRECWFGSHLIAALAFSLVPNLLAALIAMPVMGQGWMILLYWFGASAMQYIFFLGTALVSAMIVGNRFAMMAVYVLINFLSVLFYWFAATIYEPMLYGVQFSNNGFILLSPCSQMTRFHYLVDVKSLAVSTAQIPYLLDGEPTTIISDKMAGVYAEFVTNDGAFAVSLGSGWGYIALCAVIGVALVFLALWLYRRRKLETAGDFIAIPALEPVFLVLFTLGVGAFFQLFAELFGLGVQMIFLAAGLVVGYYGGRMLLMRTTRVFQPKALAGIAAIGILMGGSIGLMKIDAFGIVRNIPETAKIESVLMSEGYYVAFNSPRYTFTEAEDIEAIRSLHQDVLDDRPLDTDGYGVSVHLLYTLSDGRTVERYYPDLRTDSAAGQKLKDYYGTMEFVMEIREDQIPEIAENITYFWFGRDALNANELKHYDMEALLRAIAADCKAGNMIQNRGYHLGQQEAGWLELEYRDSNSEGHYISVYVYDSCENTISWLENYNFPLDYYPVGG